MRQDYDKFRAEQAEIVVVVRSPADKVRDYWKENRLPYVGVPDPDGEIGKRFLQKWRLFKLGLMPALFLVDREGAIVLVHYSSGMSDIPSNASVLEALKHTRK